MNVRNGYSTLQIGLHWLVAALIIAAWLMSDGMGRELRDRVQSGATGVEGNTWHVWLGGAAFALILIRIVVRLRQGAPAPLPAPNPRMELAAIWGHRLLYAGMIGAPALGAAAWYGGLRDLGDIHVYVANAMLLLALGHAAVGFYHHYVLKDATMRRMIRPAR